MSRTKKIVIASAAAGVTAVGAVVGISTIANADPTPTPSATTAPSDQPGGPGRGGPGGPGRGHGPMDDQLAKQLASKLGVDEAKVTEALKAIRDANKPSTPPSTPPVKPTPGSRPDPAARDAELAKALAGKLGVDEAKVKAALDEVRAARQAERAAALKDRLAAAVKAGTLTQAEADAVQKAVDKGVIQVGPGR